MTEIADRYRRRADAFERMIAAVRPEQWSNPSPSERLLGLIGRDPGWTAGR